MNEQPDNWYHICLAFLTVPLSHRKADPCSVLLAHEACISVPAGPCTMSLPTTFRAAQCSAGVKVEPNLVNGSAGGTGLQSDCSRHHCVEGDTVQRIFESELSSFLGELNSVMLSSDEVVTFPALHWIITLGTWEHFVSKTQVFQLLQQSRHHGEGKQKFSLVPNYM